MAIKIDLTGQRFGKLTVTGIAVDIPGKKKKWNCRCDCGNECIVSGSNLRSGHTTECLRCGYEATRAYNTTHGKTGTKIYAIWRGMLNRCENPKAKSFPDYGGRGIKVCPEWHDGGTFIKWAENSGYAEGLEIDRIDNNGDYEPDNCRWIERLLNSNNKRNNKLIEHNGETKTLAEWARVYNVSYKNLSRCLLVGYSLDDAVKRLRNGERTHRGSKAWLKNRGE